MSLQSLFGFGIPRLTARGGIDIERLAVHWPLRRVLSFLGYDIDDVCNDPWAKIQVLGYYRLYRQIERSGEITELEKQWNPTGERI